MLNCINVPKLCKKIVALSLAAAFTLSGCKAPSSEVKQIRFQNKTTAINADNICRKSSEPKTVSEATKNAFNKNLYSYAVEVFSARVLTLKYRDNSDPYSHLKINLDPAKLTSDFPASCLNLKQSNTGNTINASTIIKEVVQKFNDPKHVYTFTYPSYYKIEDKCLQRPDVKNIVSVFLEQNLKLVSTGLEQICAQSQATNSPLSFISEIALGYLNSTNFNNTEVAAYCAILEERKQETAASNDFQANVMPWIIGGTSIAAGTLANIFSLGVSGEAVNLTSSAVSVGRHFVRMAPVLEMIKSLKQLDKNLGINTACSLTFYQEQIDLLFQNVVVDTLGEIIGFSIGAALPGIGRVVSNSIRNEGKFIRSSSGKAYLVLKEGSYLGDEFIQLPEAAKILNIIEAAKGKVKNKLGGSVEIIDDLANSLKAFFQKIKPNVAIDAAGKETTVTPSVLHHLEAKELKQIGASSGDVLSEIGTNKFNEILKLPKGSRPLPETYLSKKLIETHLAEFDGGASFLVATEALDKYGRDILGRPDNTQFVMSKTGMDALLKKTGANVAAIEKELGIPAGMWQGKKLSRINIPKPRALNLRIPSGNEAGANELWLPGGRLPTGESEAVINRIPKELYTEEAINQ